MVKVVEGKRKGPARAPENEWERQRLTILQLECAALTKTLHDERQLANIRALLLHLLERVCQAALDAYEDDRGQLPAAMIELQRMMRLGDRR